MTRTNTVSTTLILSLLIASALFTMTTVKPASAQSVQTPSTPQFSAAYVNSTYYVPPVYSTDPYTGQQVMSEAGHYVQNLTINIDIRNQPFTSTTMVPNNYTQTSYQTQLYYCIRWKGHYENWTNIENEIPDLTYNVDKLVVQIKDSGNTTQIYLLQSIGFVSEGGEIDFQIKAIVGYPYQYYGGHISPIGTAFHVEAQNGWSNTQTLKINYNVNSTSITTADAEPAPTPTPTPVPTPTPSVPEYSLQVITALLASTLFTVAVLKRKKSRGCANASL
jgi:hypothetical protein